MAKTPGFAAYKKRTSVFIPWFPEKDWMTAIVNLPEKKQIELFYRTFTINIYYKVKWYRDIGVASDWLKRA
jgi:hypothetical protein